MKIGLIVLDTLRYDVASECLDLSEMADHVFTNMYSTSRWTVPAHASLFTGLYPTEVGSHSQERKLTTTRRTLAEKLEESGYDTVALSNNVHLDTFFNFDRGFSNLVRGPNLKGRPTDSTDEFDWDELFSTIGDGLLRYPRALRKIVKSDSPTLQTLRTGFTLLRSGATVEGSNTLSWAHEGADEHLNDPSDDLFFFANLMPTHFPYEPPAGYSDKEPLDAQPFHLTLRDEPVTEEEHERHWENYKGAARYLNDELPKIVNKIDWDALFIISDHGEMFGEYGFRGHEYGIWEELVHVPAVALGSAIPDGKTETVTSLLDIHRTLLDLANADTSDFTRGSNLFEIDSTDDRAVYAESTGVGQYSPDATGILSKIPSRWNDDHYMLRTEDIMFIHDKSGDYVMNVESGRARTDLVDEYRECVDKIRSNRKDFTQQGRDETMPDEIEDRLKHLGYK